MINLSNGMTLEELQEFKKKHERHADIEVVEDQLQIFLKDEAGKLLGLLSVTISKESPVNAENGRVLKETKPWWSILVL